MMLYNEHTNQIINYTLLLIKSELRKHSFFDTTIQTTTYFKWYFYQSKKVVIQFVF